MNKLSQEKSPYLLQHKNNPVHWYPWGKEAFEKAKAENKPIFLSIGYSSCHWCHVMEHESFEDQEVADYLNQNFISVKVDREERPDVDSVYMLVCQMMTGHGGWPLSIFMTSSQQPFFAGTYFPKNTLHGRLGFVDVLKRIQYVWSQQKKDLHTTIQNIDLAIKEAQKVQPETIQIESLVRTTVQDLKTLFDPNKGGFGVKPKFPSPHKILFLMEQYRWTKDDELLMIIHKTLREMHGGGVFDHVRGGFHRYSTDENWQLPHFEKMLYDQALCARMYLEAYQLTKIELYRIVSEKIINFVQESLSEGQGYFCAFDADSEGEEGAFYTWTYGELQQTLTSQELYRLEQVFDIREGGNFEDEATHEPIPKNILYLKKAIEGSSKEYTSLSDVFQKLKNKAQSRVHPMRDEKILADWNALYVQTLLKAYDILGERKYLELAENSIGYFEKNLIQNGKIYHRVCDGEVLEKSFLDDYAQAIAMYLQHYLVVGSTDSLEKAVDFADQVFEEYMDSKAGSFFLTSKLDQDIFARTKEVYDGAYPSGNSFMYENLVLLWNITGQTKYKKIIEMFNSNYGAHLASSPTGFVYLIRGLSLWYRGSLEIQIQGAWDEKSKTEIESIVREYYLPEKIIKITDSDKPQIQICRGMSCSLPILTLSDFKNELRALYSV